MNASHLAQVAKKLVAAGKGLLAMDESNRTCNKWFAAAGIPQTEEVRRAYRQLSFTTPGLGNSISGTTLYDETICPDANVVKAQQGLLHRAECNRAASRGEYLAAMERT